jgi:hypothetical protein
MLTWLDSSLSRQERLVSLLTKWGDLVRFDLVRFVFVSAKRLVSLLVVFVTISDLVRFVFVSARETDVFANKVGRFG